MRFLLFFCCLFVVTETAIAQRASIITPTEPVHLVESKLQIPSQYKSEFPDREYKLWMPQGFSASLYFGSFDRSFDYSYPRMVALDSQNVIHYADVFFGDIRALRDLDHDGIADTAMTITRRIDSAHSIAFYKGAMYVGTPTMIRKLRDTDGDGFYETEDPFIGNLPSYGPFNHWTRTIVFDEDKKKLYVSVGTSCDACRLVDTLGNPDPERSTILEFNDDGTGKRIFATGLRNAVGLAIDPNTRKLWATNADRNKLGDDLPEEILTSVKDGGFYGWPIAYGIRDWTDFAADPEYTSMLPMTAEDTAKVASMEIADYFLSAHSTPFGIHFYQGSKFPQEYRTGYVCVKGSADSKVPHGYKIQRFWEEGGIHKIADFAVGFSEDSSSYKIWGRPLAAVEDREGNLYIVLDHMRTIMKISYTPSSVERLENDKQQEMIVVRRGNDLDLSIQGIESTQPVSFEVFSMTGQRILSSETSDHSGDEGIQLKLPQLSSGVYLCRVRVGHDLFTGSFYIL